MLSTTKLLTAIERKLTAMPDVMYDVHTAQQYGNTMIFINTEYYIDLRWNNATLYKNSSSHIHIFENTTLSEYLADRICLQVDLCRKNVEEKKDEEDIAEQFCEKIRRLLNATTLNELN